MCLVQPMDEHIQTPKQNNEVELLCSLSLPEPHYHLLSIDSQRLGRFLVRVVHTMLYISVWVSLWIHSCLVFSKAVFFSYLPGWVTDRLTNKKKGKAHHQKEAFLVGKKCWYGLLWKPWLCLKHRSIIRNIMKWFIQACDASLETTQRCPQGMHQISIFLVVLCVKHIILNEKYILNIKKMLMSTIVSSTIRI